MTAWVASEPLLLINFILCGALMRRGKEFYSQNYKKALDLHERGIAIKDIAKTLGLSYSAVYSWVSKSRRPGKGALIKFKEVLRSRGPMPAALIKKEKKSTMISIILLGNAVLVSKEGLSKASNWASMPIGIIYLGRSSC